MSCRMDAPMPPMAAYLFLLHADSAALAWEYLRRNPQYREAFSDQASSENWGLMFWVDPVFDAIAVRPQWSSQRQLGLNLQPEDDPSDNGHAFNMWTMPGYKQVEHDGCHLRICCFTGFRVIRMVLTKGLGHGMAYSYAMRAGLCLCDYWLAWLDQLTHLDRREPVASVLHARPSRLALTHMRTLQALDAHAAGASHREIAEAIFGTDEVATRWHADSELRAQVRHLLKRGHAYVNGNYRKLLTATN